GNHYPTPSCRQHNRLYRSIRIEKAFKTGDQAGWNWAIGAHSILGDDDPRATGCNRATDFRRLPESTTAWTYDNSPGGGGPPPPWISFSVITTHLPVSVRVSDLTRLLVFSNPFK